MSSSARLFWRLLRPTLRPLVRSVPPRRDRLCSLASLDLVRKHSSLIPMEVSKDKWVESDKALAKKMITVVTDAARRPQFFAPSPGSPRPPSPFCPRVQGSPSTFRVRVCLPLLPLPTTIHKDLFALFSMHVPCQLLTDESRERSAAHHYFTILHPLLAIAVLLLSLNLLSIMIGSVVHSYEYEGQGQKRTVTQKIFIGNISSNMMGSQKKS